MITIAELQKLSLDRLKDAKALYQAERYDGAFYICGYAVEIALKRKICMTLGWPGYPDGKKEFEKLQSFKTHDLDMLLHCSGIENFIKTEFFSEWSIINSWTSEIRYSTKTKPMQTVKLLLESAETLLNQL